MAPEKKSILRQVLLLIIGAAIVGVPTWALNIEHRQTVQEATLKLMGDQVVMIQKTQKSMYDDMALMQTQQQVSQEALKNLQDNTERLTKLIDRMYAR